MLLKTLLAAAVCLLTVGCSKSDGEICIDNYMELYDKAHPDASSNARHAFKQMVSLRCTDPGMR